MSAWSSVESARAIGEGERRAQPCASGTILCNTGRKHRVLSRWHHPRARTLAACMKVALAQVVHAEHGLNIVVDACAAKPQSLLAWGIKSAADGVVLRARECALRGMHRCISRGRCSAAIDRTSHLGPGTLQGGGEDFSLPYPPLLGAGNGAREEENSACATCVLSTHYCQDSLEKRGQHT